MFILKPKPTADPDAIVNFIHNIRQCRRRATWQSRIEDDPDLNVNDLAGGNFDDAYDHGIIDGVVQLSDEILGLFDVMPADSWFAIVTLDISYTWLQTLKLP